jgi:hypothetical protein
MAEPRLPARQRAPALAFAGFLLLVAGSGAVLFLEKLGGAPARIQAFYLGSEAAFTPPRSLEGLLETAVPHLLAIPLVLFAVIHVVGAVGTLAPALHRRLVQASFGLALAGLAAGFGVRWVAPWLSWAKLGAFVGFELLLVGWAVLLAVVAWPPPRTHRSGRRVRLHLDGGARGRVA